MSLAGWAAELAARFRRLLVAWMLALLRRHARVPRHVAFIMDGNRRYADRARLPRRADGHSAGAAKLQEVLEWCVALDIRVVTVYAFSVENFRRTPDEVAAIMALAMARFADFAERSAFVRDNEIAVRVLGELDMLPADVRAAALRAMALTRGHTRHVLQICFPYTSRAEILAATRDVLRLRYVGAPSSVDMRCEYMRVPSKCGEAGDAPAGPADSCAESQPLFRMSRTPTCAAWQPDALGEPSVVAALIDGLVYTSRDAAAAAHPPDVILRTSGECRMSEFLTWQAAAHGAMVAFVPALWPEFSLWRFASVLMRYHLRAGGQTGGGRAETARTDPAVDAAIAERRALFWREVDSCAA